MADFFLFICSILSFSMMSIKMNTGAGTHTDNETCTQTDTHEQIHLHDQTHARAHTHTHIPFVGWTELVFSNYQNISKAISIIRKYRL